MFALLPNSYIAVTLFGSWILYDEVRDTGCDPSGAVEDNETCDPDGVDVFGSLFGVTIAAAVLPQLSVSIAAFASEFHFFRILLRSMPSSLVDSRDTISYVQAQELLATQLCKL